MSNGVEVIVRENKTVGSGSVKTPIVPMPVTGFAMTTLPPTTVSNHFHLVEHPDRPNTAIDHLLHSIVRSATPDMVTKTLLTTFTLLQTVLQNESTIVNSREETISNVVTQKVRPVGIEYTPRAEASTIQPELLQSLYSSHLTNTLTTIYTYYNTFNGQGSLPVVLTSVKTVENVITVPAYLQPSSYYPLQLSTMSRVFETETYYSTLTFSKTIYDAESRTQLSTTLETLTQVVVTEALIPAYPTTAQLMTPTFLEPSPPSSELTKTYFTTFTTFLTTLDGADFVTRSTTSVTSNVVMESRVPVPSPVLPLEAKTQTKLLRPVMIFATKTYYTTTTYLTSILGAGNITRIQSRTQVVSNVVTEALSTALDAEYLIALKSSYLAQHSTLLEVTSSVEEFYPIRTIEGTYVPEPSLYPIFPHWPKDDDEGIMDPEPVAPLPFKTGVPSLIPHGDYEDMKSGIHHIVSVLAASSEIEPTKTGSGVYPTVSVEPEDSSTEDVTIRYEEDELSTLPDLEFGEETERPASHLPTPPLHSQSIPLEKDTALYTYGDEDLDTTTPVMDDEHVLQSVYINNKLVAKPVLKSPSSSGTLIIHNRPVMIHNQKEQSNYMMDSAKPISEADTNQQIFDLLSDLTSGEALEPPDYYDEIKEEDAFKEHEDGTLDPNIYNLSTDKRPAGLVVAQPEKKNGTATTSAPQTEFGHLDPVDTSTEAEAPRPDVYESDPGSTEPVPVSNERVTVIKWSANGNPDHSEVVLGTQKPTQESSTEAPPTYTVTTKRPKVTTPVPPAPIPDEYQDSSEASTKIYNLFVRKPATSTSTSTEVEDTQNDDKSEEAESNEDDDERRPSGAFSSGSTGGTGPSKTSLVIPASGPGLAAAPGEPASSVVSTGINWKPLLNLGAIGLGGLGASTLTKLTPLFSSMAGYLKSGFVLPVIARNDTHHHFKNERPYRPYWPGNHEPNYIPIGSMSQNAPPQSFRPPADAIPRHPIVSHANEPNFRPPAPTQKPGAHRFENGPQPPPSYNFQPPNDQHPNIYSQMGKGDQSSNVVKVVAGNPINALPVNRSPAIHFIKKEGNEKRRPSFVRPPPRSQDGPGPWQQQIILPFPPEKESEEHKRPPPRLNSRHPNPVQIGTAEISQVSRPMMNLNQYQRPQRPLEDNIPRPSEEAPQRFILSPHQQQWNEVNQFFNGMPKPGGMDNPFNQGAQRPLQHHFQHHTIRDSSEEESRPINFIPPRPIPPSVQTPNHFQSFRPPAQPPPAGHFLGPVLDLSSEELQQAGGNDRPLPQQQPQQRPMSQESNSEEGFLRPENNPMLFQRRPQPEPPRPPPTPSHFSHKPENNQGAFRPMNMQNQRPQQMDQRPPMQQQQDQPLLGPGFNIEIETPRPPPFRTQGGFYEIIPSQAIHHSEEEVRHPGGQTQQQGPGEAQPSRRPPVLLPGVQIDQGSEEAQQNRLPPVLLPGGQADQSSEESLQNHRPQGLLPGGQQQPGPEGQPGNFQQRPQNHEHPNLQQRPGHQGQPGNFQQRPENQEHPSFQERPGHQGQPVNFQQRPEKQEHPSFQERPGHQGQPGNFQQRPGSQEHPSFQQRPGQQGHPNFQQQRPENQGHPNFQQQRPENQGHPNFQQGPENQGHFHFQQQGPGNQGHPNFQQHRPGIHFQQRPHPGNFQQRPHFQQQPESQEQPGNFQQRPNPSNTQEPESEEQPDNFQRRPPVLLPGSQELPDNLQHEEQPGSSQKRPPILLPGSEELHWNQNSHQSAENLEEQESSSFARPPYRQRPLPPMYRPTPHQPPFMQRPSTVYFVHETYDPVPSTEPPTTSTTTPRPPESYPQLIIKEISPGTTTTTTTTRPIFVPKPNFIRRFSTTARPTTTTTLRTTPAPNKTEHFFGLYPQGFDVSPTVADMFGFSSSKEGGRDTTMSNEILDQGEFSKFSGSLSTSSRPLDLQQYFPNGGSDLNSFSGSEDSESIIDPISHLVIKSPFEHNNFTRMPETTENVRSSSGIPPAPDSEEQEALLNEFRVPDGFFSGSTPKDYNMWWPTTFQPQPDTTKVTPDNYVQPTTFRNTVRPTTYRNIVRPTTFRPRMPLQKIRPEVNSANPVYDDDEGLEDVKLKNIEIHKTPNFMRRPSGPGLTPAKQHPVFALIDNSFEEEDEDTENLTAPLESLRENPKKPNEASTRPKASAEAQEASPEAPKPKPALNEESKEYTDGDENEETNETYELAPPGYPLTRLRPPPPPPMTPENQRRRPFIRRPLPAPPEQAKRPGAFETFTNMFRRPFGQEHPPGPPRQNPSIIRRPNNQGFRPPLSPNMNGLQPNGPNSNSGPPPNRQNNDGHPSRPNSQNDPPPNRPQINSGPPLNRPTNDNDGPPSRPSNNNGPLQNRPNNSDQPPRPNSNNGPPPSRPNTNYGQPPNRPSSSSGPPPSRQNSNYGPPPNRPVVTNGPPPNRPVVVTNGPPPNRPVVTNGPPPNRPIVTNGPPPNRPVVTNGPPPNQRFPFRPDFSDSFNRVRPIPLNPAVAEATESKPQTPILVRRPSTTTSTTPTPLDLDLSYEEDDEEELPEKNDVQVEVTTAKSSLSISTPIIANQSKRPTDLTPAAANDPNYAEEEEDEESQELGAKSPEESQKQSPRPNHIGGHLVNTFRPQQSPAQRFPRPSPPKAGSSKETSKEQSGSAEFSRPPPKTEMEPPPIDSHHLKPSILELPSNGPIRYRPGRPGDGLFRPNLLRPEQEILKPEPVRPNPTFHTIASVDEDNKIVGTNVVPVIVPSRSGSSRPQIQPTSVSEAPQHIEPTKPVIIGSVEPVELEPEDSDEETPSLGSTESSVFKYAGGKLKTVLFETSSTASRPSFSRTVTKTFQRTRGGFTASGSSTSPVTPTRTSEVTRNVSPTRKPFTRPPPAQENEARPTTPRPNARKPFMPIRNPYTPSLPPWNRRTSTTAVPTTAVTGSTPRPRFSSTVRTRVTNGFQARPRPTTPSPSSSLATEESKHVPVTPLSSPATVDTTILSSASNANTAIMNPTTFRPANRPTFLTSVTERSTSTTVSSTKEPDSTEDEDSSEISENPTILFTKNGTISVSKNAQIVPTRVSQRGGTRRPLQSSVIVSTSSSVSTRLSPSSTTRYVTHTETLTQTLTETETTVVPASSVGSDPVTHTVMITKTLPPQTLISTIVGTVTLVNTVEVTPTTVRSTIMSEPTKAIFTVTETKISSSEVTEPDDKLMHAGILTNSRRPVSKRPPPRSTTPPTVPEKKLTVPSLLESGCKANCSKHGNQMCKTFGNTTTPARCVCNPGYARFKANAPCRPTFTYEMNMAVNNMEGMSFNLNDLKKESSESYANFATVTKEALDKAFLSTDIKRQFQGAEVMKIKPELVPSDKGNSMEPKINVQFLVQLTVNMTEDRIRNHLLRTLKATNYSVGRTGVISSRNMSDLSSRDFNECSNVEYNDCSENAECINMRGSFGCQCRVGFKDRSKKHKPGRDCNEMAGCSECNYRGNCYSDKYGNSSCDCFRWYGGAECQINLKVLLMTIIGVGAILFFLVLLCGILICRRNRRSRERPGSGRFMRYRSPTSQATMERTAIMHDTGSSSSSDGSETPPTRVNHPSFTPDSLVVDTTDKEHGRGGRGGDLMNFSLRNVVMDQQDRSLTVVIPRAKIRASSRPSSRPNMGSGGASLGPDTAADLATTERKLISYLDQGPSYPVPTHKGMGTGPVASTSRQSTLQRNNEAKAFRKLSLQERRISTGALVSSGTEVSARGGMRRRSTGLESELPVRAYDKTLSDMRSYDETTVRSHAKQLFSSETSRASCYSCKPPSYCAYSESAGHTMAEKDGASTVYTTQGKLFRMSNDSDSNLSSD